MNPLDDYVTYNTDDSINQISLKQNYPKSIPIRVKDLLNVVTDDNCQILFKFDNEFYPFDEKDSFADYLIREITIQDKPLSDIVDTEMDENPWEHHFPIVIIVIAKQVFLNGQSYCI